MKDNEKIIKEMEKEFKPDKSVYEGYWEIKLEVWEYSFTQMETFMKEID